VSDTAAANIVSLQSNLIKVIAPEGYTAGNVSVTFMGLKLTGTSLSPSVPEGDVSSFYMQNYEQPFTSDLMTPAQIGSSGKWAVADYWKINSGGLDQLNSGATARTGGLSYGNMATGELILQAGWGDAIGNTLNNAKLYQTMSLPAGNYSFEVNINNFSFVSGSTTYIVAAAKDSIPDIGEVASYSISYTNFNDVSSSNNATKRTLNFTLSSYSTVSVGFVSTQIANSWFRVGLVRLNLIK